jgi:hypothetical protein
VYAINKSDEMNLRNKRSAFVMESGTKKGIHLTMITTYGLARNKYSGEIQAEVVMDDFFE